MIPALPEPTPANLAVWTVACVVYGGLVGGVGAFVASYRQLQAVKSGSRERYVRTRTLGLVLTAAVSAAGGVVALVVALWLFSRFVGGEHTYYESRALRHVYPEESAPADWTSAWADGDTAADYLWAADREVPA